MPIVDNHNLTIGRFPVGQELADVLDDIVRGLPEAKLFGKVNLVKS